MKKLLFIHGGEAFGSYKDYINYLNSLEKFDPFDSKKAQNKFKMWSKKLNEFLPEYHCVRLEMPNKINARYPEWKINFERVLDFIDEDTVLVGHSLGANFLAKYLSENKLKTSAKSLHLVAGCYGCPGGFNLNDDLESFDQINKNTNKITIYHSVDDDIVDFSDAEKYQEKIKKAQLTKFESRGHFIQADFPELINNIRGNLT